MGLGLGGMVSVTTFFMSLTFNHRCAVFISRNRTPLMTIFHERFKCKYRKYRPVTLSTFGIKFIFITGEMLCAYGSVANFVQAFYRV